MLRGVVRLELAGKGISPAAVAVGGRAAAVSDGIADDDDARGAHRRDDVDAADEIPVLAGSWLFQLRRIQRVTGNGKGCAARPGVRCDLMLRNAP